MNNPHLDQLRATLQQADGLPEGTKEKLLGMLDALGPDGTAAPVESEPYIVTATPVDRAGLLASVESLEASHPELAALINQVATTLSGMGI